MVSQKNSTLELPLLNFPEGFEYQKFSAEAGAVFQVVYVFLRSIVPAVQTSMMFLERGQRSETFILDDSSAARS